MPETLTTEQQIVAVLTASDKALTIPEIAKAAPGVLRGNLARIVARLANHGTLRYIRASERYALAEPPPTPDRVDPAPTPADESVAAAPPTVERAIEIVIEARRGLMAREVARVFGVPTLAASDLLRAAFADGRLRREKTRDGSFRYYDPARTPGESALLAQLRVVEARAEKALGDYIAAHCDVGMFSALRASADAARHARERYEAS